MQIKTSTGVILIAIAVSLAAYGASGPATAQDAAVAPQAEVTTEAGEYLASIDHALDLARKGEYGRISRGSHEELKAARDRIAGLLEGHASKDELQPDARLAVQHAEDAIQAIIQSQDKNRMVCRREAGTGSRLPRNECLTVAQREARARAAMESTESVQRMNCVATVDHPCGG